MIENCILDGGIRYCEKGTCSVCGWNPEVDQARRQMLETNGLTQCEDGLRRLIIPKGVATDENNT